MEYREAAMARLIEVQAGQIPRALSLLVGDVVLFRASGGLVRSGSGVVEHLGALVESVLGDNGSVLAPAGGPNAVLFRAVGAGNASIVVVTGDPWRETRTSVVEVVVSA